MLQFLKDLFEKLFLGKQSTDTEVHLNIPPEEHPDVDTPPSLESHQKKVLAIAEKEIGVKEGKGAKSIEKYHAFATKDNKVGASQSVPWCASFVCYCLEMAGLQSTNSKSARSYESYGKSTLSPVPGDIAVFWRGTKNSGKGHVSFFIGYDNSGNIKCLGGNQGDEVCVAVYDKSRLLGFRTYAG